MADEGGLDGWLQTKDGADPFADLSHAQGTAKPKKHSSFQSFGFVANLLKGVLKKGYNVPTPIQRKCIPVILEGHDLIAMARTGSGKTAAFLLPVLNMLKEHKTTMGVRAIILSPTRELAQQTLSFCNALGKFMDLRCCLIVGGDSMEVQFEKLSANPDIIIATPGRLRHLLVEVPTFSLKEVKHVIFDEGDRLFEMGFADDIKEIMDKIQPNHQTCVFSATLPSLLASFAQAGLNNPKMVRLDAESQISDKLELQFIRVRSKDKVAALFYLLRDYVPEGKQTMVFCSTRHHVEFLHTLFQSLYPTPPSVAIYGKMDQAARKIALAKFTKRKADVMFVTDLAARGIDIPILDYVINFDFPPKAKLFVHRVGRVARAGRSGTAISLADSMEAAYMLDLLKYLHKKVVVPPNTPTNPDEISLGTIPQSLLDPTGERIFAALEAAPDLYSLQRSMINAEGLYIKTRPTATKESAEEAKRIPKDVHHPIFAARVDRLEEDRSAFLHKISQFKPNSTVFEFQAKTKDEKVQAALQTMTAKRAAHSAMIERHRAAASSAAPVAAYPQFAPEQEGAELGSDDEAPQAEPEVKGKTFRDNAFYIAHQRPNAHVEKELDLREQKHDNANIEELIFDVIPEDAKDIFKKRTALQWDRKKKRYVQQSGGMDKSAILKGTIKSESGTAIRKSKVKPGQIYQDWAKRSHKAIAKAGEEEEMDSLRRYQDDKVQSRKKWRNPSKEAGAKDELKSKEDIKRARKQKEKAKTPKGILKRPGERKEDAKDRPDLKMNLSPEEERRAELQQSGGKRMIRQSTKGNLGRDEEERKRLSRQTSGTETTDTDDGSSSSHAPSSAKVNANPMRKGSLGSKPASPKPLQREEKDEEAADAREEADEPEETSKGRYSPRPSSSKAAPSSPKSGKETTSEREKKKGSCVIS